MNKGGRYQAIKLKDKRKNSRGLIVSPVCMSQENCFLLRNYKKPNKMR